MSAALLKNTQYGNGSVVCRARYAVIESHVIIQWLIKCYPSYRVNVKVFGTHEFCHNHRPEFIVDFINPL